MKSQKLRTFGRIFIFLIVSAALIVSTSAYYTFTPYNGRLTTGVYKITYNNHIAAGAYQTAANGAVADWNWAVNSNNNGSGVDVYMISTTGKATINIWADDRKNVDWAGLTTFYNNGTAVYPWNGNYNQANIMANTVNCDAANVTSKELRSVYCHEFGHAFGLAHNPVDKGTLMFQGVRSRSAYAPTGDEVKGVNALYQ